MALTVGVPVETLPGERRVAMVPEVVARLKKKGLDVVVESGAGNQAFYPDETFEKEGARIVDRATAFGSDVVVKVQPPNEEEVGLLKKGSTYVGFLNPFDAPDVVRMLAEQGVTAMAMELVPRITRAQKMDALSAMAAVSGYKAVLLAAEASPKFFPLLTTAAGTIRPSNLLVLGAGVAGLQAIATGRRLGARVSAYDIREAVREEVQSLGAAFVELELEIGDMQDTGGYAKALAEEKARRQTELLVPVIAKSDVVITTALIPGRPAPTLITEEAVKAMAPGSIIVDIAAPNGGNCVLTEPGETVTKHGVTIFGPLNLPSTMPIHASDMYARTVGAMLLEFASAEGFKTDFEDEVFKGACLTYNGEVVNERVKTLLAA